MGIATPLSTSGRLIVDANGRRVELAGVELDRGPHGRRGRRGPGPRAPGRAGRNHRRPGPQLRAAAVQPADDAADHARPRRLPRCEYRPARVHADGGVRRVRGRAGRRGPDRHPRLPHAGRLCWCCSNDDGNGLWYSDRSPAEAFMAAWRDMATRYVSQPLVAAMDIKNEPRPARVGWRTLTPTWGRGEADRLRRDVHGGGRPHPRCQPGAADPVRRPGLRRGPHRRRGPPVRLQNAGKVGYGRDDYPWFIPAISPGRRSSIS